MTLVAGMTVLMLLLLLVSVPVAFAVGISAVAALSAMGVTWQLVPARLFTGVDSFTLLAIPMYVVAGGLMLKVGIADKLINLALAAIGHRRGGLGNTAVISSVMFSGISGSTSAATAALGSILIPSMHARGYSRPDATAILSGAAAAGILVPPAMSMIVFSGLTGSSVSALFAAGVLPALTCAAAIMLYVRWHAGRAGVDPLPRLTRSERWQALREGLPSLALPILVFGGIFGGIFTATEAGVIAVLYAAALGGLVYRTLSSRDLYDVLAAAVQTCGVVLMMVTISGIFSWVLTANQVPRLLVDTIGTYELSQFLFLLCIIVVFILLGMIMDELAIMVMLIPIALPLVEALGISTIHFGVVVIGCVGIGLFSPPVASALLVACSVGQVKIEEVARPLAPHLLIIAVVVILLAAVPGFTLLLPRLMGMNV
ncbi:MAG: TRAP transporter large permease [Pseudomonadota bacterium]